jgi:type I restriction enzyme, S subunit
MLDQLPAYLGDCYHDDLYGALPSHWRVLKLSQVADVIGGGTPSSADAGHFGDEIPWITPKDLSRRKVRTIFGGERSLSSRGLKSSAAKVLPAGAVIVSTRAPVGLAAIAGGAVTTNQGCRSLVPRSADISSEFLWYLVSSRTDYLDQAANGTTFREISGGNLKTLRFPFPPLDEQEAIVRFLDWANGRLERVIRGKRKVIALLTEQKQAIIHRAVTRGLDPSVPLKPSGIPWLGDIPEAWDLTALNRYWRVTDCKHLTVPFVDGGIPLASVREVQSFTLNLSGSNATTAEWYQLLIQGDRKPELGDLIYSRNASVGACAIVETSEQFAMGQDVCLIRSDSQDNLYLNYVLHSPMMERQLEMLLVGSTFKRINVSDIKRLLIPVPPMSEQVQIACMLRTESVAFAASITRVREEIRLLNEYRTRLIADVVTGKLDVRAAARNLPVEELEESVDYIEDLVDDGEFDDEEAVA